MSNRYGRAGKGAVRADTAAAFFDHYAYEGAVLVTGAEPYAAAGRTLRVNGVPVTPSDKRAIRRWRNGHSTHVGLKSLVPMLARYGFDLPWFHGWAKLHRRPVVDK